MSFVLKSDNFNTKLRHKRNKKTKSHAYKKKVMYHKSNNAKDKSCAYRA